MTVRPIVMYPDVRLRRPALPVDTFDGALRALADDLRDTLVSVAGIGITAPHIGVSVLLFVLRLGPGPELRVYANPELIEVSVETARHEEGSVSMPGIVEAVERPARVRIRFRDLDGKEHEETADGFRAACLQHEIDQLDGLFWIHRLSRLRRDRVIKRWEKQRRTA